MPDNVDYLTLLQYSPRGISDISRTSRTVRDTIKGGRIDTFKKRFSEIISDNIDAVSPFLNTNVTLVPTPRSSLVRTGDLWPSLEICKMLEELKLGTVTECLKRKTAIKKSHLYFDADERPSIKDQMDSMEVITSMPNMNITLVDDILTLGRTTMAGSLKIYEKFPNATVRVFSLIQTKGLVKEILEIKNVQVGNIKYYPLSGKCTRQP